MLELNTGFDVIRYLINERNQMHEQLQELQDRLSSLEYEVRITNRSLAERNAELECLSSPYSPDGDANCNFHP